MMQPQEYLVTDTKRVADYIDRVIGVEYEITLLDNTSNQGSITVFDLEYQEHLMLRDFISLNNLWSE